MGATDCVNSSPTSLHPTAALLTPAAIEVAPAAQEGTGDPIFAATWTLLGAPALSLPLLTGESGLPLGLQVVGAARRDFLFSTRRHGWCEKRAYGIGVI
jgi:Asp-tRNA(Asn)/Glu-tRNA(Gln) amidotransferase A subunit family amidase